MASQRLSQKNAFCITWIVKNYNYWWYLSPGRIESPEFIVDTMEKTKWRLIVYPLPYCGTIDCFLSRVEECEGPPNIEVEFQLELLAMDGSPLTSRVLKHSFTKGDSSYLFESDIRNSSYLLHGKLAVRCTMRKSNGYMETRTFLARTIMGVKRRSFNWKFSYYNLLKAEKLTYRIEPASEDEIDITLHLSICREESCVNMSITLVPDFKKPIDFTFKYALFDAAGKSLKDGESLGMDNELIFQLLSLEKEQSEKISSSPRDHLTLQCECADTTKVIYQHIENIGQPQDSHRAQEHPHPSVTENALTEAVHTLKKHFSSLHSESFLSDVKLKTNASTHPAHKAVLSARSPVFKAMFLTEMKEKSGQCVEIPDLDDETVRLMLQFMYTADLPDLRWNTACRLYQAADKYEILSLKKTSSSFLVSNLSVINACELLAFSDMHQDADLKQAVQEFIVKQDAEFFTSDEWKKFIETNTKLAADTMVLKFQK
ncbi:TD and POZ domain-containing protein 1-like [Caerostris extrusa]|uniref:TD and POZ domain-containing protein 1-like n=1 Tax=Caerostris extrusa TaxID=172846 RepID=A0AAV4X3P6_CAEEX|nr:TD and POZ domain-containing protein 1-like [Caerostris extrusa]